MKVTVIGSGYVGLATEACPSEMVNDVFCLDVGCNKIDVLNGGGESINEPGLAELVHRNVGAGRLQLHRCGGHCSPKHVQISSR